MSAVQPLLALYVWANSTRADLGSEGTEDTSMTKVYKTSIGTTRIKTPRTCSVLISSTLGASCIETANGTAEGAPSKRATRHRDGHLRQSQRV